MRPVSAAWVAEVTHGTLSGAAEGLITSVERDSRECGPGALYVAFPGERADGHDFVEAAATAGAALHLVTRPVSRPHVLVSDAVEAIGLLAAAYLSLLRSEGDITVIGITGSVGKTTTKDLLAHILPDCVAPVGSFNNEIGLPLTVLRAGPGTRYLVLEMGASGVGHIAYLTRIAPPDVVVVLVVGSAHLGEYASLDEVADAKAEIILGRTEGAAVLLNADDPRVAAMAKLAPGAWTFGVGNGDVRAEGLDTVEARANFTLLGPDGTSAPVALRLVGEHQVTNALAAAAVALSCGMTVPDVAARLNSATPLSEHRMAVTVRPDGVTVIDDSYNASPESMRAALRALRDLAGAGRSVAVLGEMLEMGAGSIAAHDELGALAVRLGIGHVVMVGQGTRPAYDAAVREGSFGDEAAFAATIDEARAHLSGWLAPGDTVLVKASHGTGLWRLADELAGGAA